MLDEDAFGDDEVYAGLALVRPKPIFRLNVNTSSPLSHRRFLSRLGSGGGRRARDPAGLNGIGALALNPAGPLAGTDSRRVCSRDGPGRAGAVEGAAAEAAKAAVAVGRPARVQEAGLQQGPEGPKGRTIRIEPLAPGTPSLAGEAPSALARLTADLRHAAERLKSKEKIDTLVVPIGAMLRGGAMPRDPAGPSGGAAGGREVELVIDASAEGVAAALARLADELEDAVRRPGPEAGAAPEKAAPVKTPPHITVVLSCNGGGDLGPKRPVPRAAS